jgi:hypothetical protein
LQQKPNSLKRLRVLPLYGHAKERSRRHRQIEKQTSQRLQQLLHWGTKSNYCSKLLLLPARSLTLMFAQRRQDVPDTFMRQRHFYQAAQRSINQVSDRKLAAVCLLAWWTSQEYHPCWSTHCCRSDLRGSPEEAHDVPTIAPANRFIPAGSPQSRVHQHASSPLPGWLPRSLLPSGMKYSVPDTTQCTRAFLHESRLPFIGSESTAVRALRLSTT